MHILYISREYPPSKRAGGIASYLKDMTGEMITRGNKVTVICASDDTRKEVDVFDDGVRIIRLSKGDFVISAYEKRCKSVKKMRCIYRFISYRMKIRRKIQEINKVDDIDIIEVPEYGAESLFINGLGIPVIVRLHTPTLLDRTTGEIKIKNIKKIHHILIGLVEILIVKRSKYITSCSESLKKCFVNMCKIKSDNVRVIYNPMNLIEYKDEFNKEKFNDINECRVMFAGTIVKEKGIYNLIEACKRINYHQNSVRLIIAGKINDSDRYIIDKMKEKYDWLECLGFIDRQKLYELYGKCHISCFPSFWEAFGIVIVEAMSFDSIVVATKNGGPKEIIDDGKDGYLIDPFDIDNISNVIKNIINSDKEELFKIVVNGRKKVHEKFSINKIVDETIKYYKSVCYEDTMV